MRLRNLPCQDTKNLEIKTDQKNVTKIITDLSLFAEQIPDLNNFHNYWQTYRQTRCNPDVRRSLTAVSVQQCRGPKSLNFPDGNFQRAKTFRAECVNRFRDKKKRVNRFRDKKTCVNSFCDKKGALIVFATKKSVCKSSLQQNKCAQIIFATKKCALIVFATKKCA